METVELPEEVQELTQISRVMQAISHPLRLKIIGAVGGEEKMVSRIMEEVGSSQSNVSQHLKVLRKVGILQQRREKNKIYCSVADRQVLQILSRAKECFCSDSHGRESVALY